MPEPRGEHLLEAVIAILATQGTDALSMRSVAKEAGVSLAQVQYYFRTKAELVAAAFAHAGDQFVATLRTTNASSLADLRDIVYAWLPLDAERERRALTWLAFSSTAATDGRLAETAAQLDADLRTWFADQLVALQRNQLIPTTTNTDTAAAHLLAVIDGLTVHSLVLPLPRRATLADTVIGSWFDQLSPSPS